MPHRTPQAFSLVEVIIAVGVFAVSVTAIVAILPAVARQGGPPAEALAAQRLPDALRLELSRLAAAGFDGLAGQVPVMNGVLENGLALVADRDANVLHSRDYLPPGSGQLDDGDQYFFVECWRFPDEPLRFDPQNGYLAIAVRVSWPYRLPGSLTPVPASSRERMVFTVCLNR